VVAGLEAPLDERGEDEVGYVLQAGLLTFTMERSHERRRTLAFARLLGHLLGAGSISVLGQGRMNVGQAVDAETVLDDVELVAGSRPVAARYDERKWTIVLPSELTAAIELLCAGTTSQLTLMKFSPALNTRGITVGDDEVLLRNHQGARLAGVRNDAEDWPTREELANLEWEHLDLGKTPTVSYKTRDNYRSAAFAQNNSDRLKGRLPIQRNLGVHHWLPTERNLSARFDWTCNAVRS